MVDSAIAEKVERGRRAAVILDAVQKLRERAGQGRAAKFKPGTVPEDIARLLAGAEEAGFHRALLMLTELAADARFGTTEAGNDL